MRIIDVDALINEIKKETEKVIEQDDGVGAFWLGYFAGLVLEQPTIQTDRDTPKKPNETTDKTWGIPHRQAVCPNCDAYLGMIHFISENSKIKVAYCESCGQAIDWEGWREDE